MRAGRHEDHVASMRAELLHPRAPKDAFSKVFEGFLIKEGHRMITPKPRDWLQWKCLQ